MLRRVIEAKRAGIYCRISQDPGGTMLGVERQKADCEVEFVRYPGASHLFLRGGPPEHREDFYTRVLGWFKAHLEVPA